MNTVDAQRERALKKCVPGYLVVKHDLVGPSKTISQGHLQTDV